MIFTDDELQRDTNEVLVNSIAQTLAHVVLSFGHLMEWAANGTCPAGAD